jgi:hypothetical protein
MSAKRTPKRRRAQAAKGGAVLPQAKKRRTEAVVRAAAFRNEVAGAGKRDSLYLAEFEGLENRPCPVTHPHFRQYVGNVILDGSLGHTE